MFLSFAMFETIDANGRVESFLIFPTDSPTVPVDRIRDIRGLPNASEVDLGSLRFYVDDGGLKVRRIVSSYREPVFRRDGDLITFEIEHSALPIADNTTGYYSLLLPSNYYGEVRTSLKHDAHWLIDSHRLLISLELYDHQQYRVARSIFISGRLRQGKSPSSSVPQISSSQIYSDWSGPRHNSVCNFIRAANASLSNDTPGVFLCHSSTDKWFTRKLAMALAGNGLKVWIDEAEIGIGESLIEKIESGILGSKYLIAVLSNNSINSRWCAEELRMAMVRQIAQKGITVLPVLVEDCELPGFLQEKKYADFRNARHFDKGVAELCAAMNPLLKATTVATDIPSQTEAIKRPQNNFPEMEATVDELRWVTCPNCGIRFALKDKSRWSDDIHKTCGQKIKLKYNGNTDA
jgi:hypothetical protein